MKNQTQQSTENLKKAHYVNNKEFLAALIEHKEKVTAAENAKEDLPLVSNYIGECFLKIATHLSYKANFVNYTYRDDMISDGIENCLVAVNKFNPEKSKNPFAYYTQIIYFAFIRRIQKEKKQQATKFKLLEEVDIDQIISQTENNEEVVNKLMEMVRKNSALVEHDRKNV
tara:strand:- start:699 stop:1211 length:513 start_codon:yes stop_codon:yes gene_type:complete